MPAEFMSAIAFLIGALVAMIASCQAVSKSTRLQQEILQRGLAAQGRILRIWRPPLFGAFTRVYFEFELADCADELGRPSPALLGGEAAAAPQVLATTGSAAARARRLVRSCHVDRRAAGELAASLPAVGASVAVRYLPDSPTQAVIAKLVSRMSRG